MKKKAMGLTCKVNQYSNLVNGKYERCLIIHLAEAYSNKDKRMKVGYQARVAMV